MVTLSKNEKDLLRGYRDKGNKKRLIQNFDLKVDKWTNKRTNDEQADEQKDFLLLQMAKWTEVLDLYIPEILCMPYV